MSNYIEMSSKLTFENVYVLAERAAAQDAELHMKIKVDVVLFNGEEEPEEGAAPASAQREEVTTAVVVQQTGKKSDKTHTYIYICIYI